MNDCDASAQGFYAGSFADAPGAGVTFFHVTADSGAFASVQTVATPDPVFSLARSADGRHLGVAGWPGGAASGLEGRVTFYELEAGSGRLARNLSLGTGGKLPCYLAAGRGAGEFFVANHGSGDLARLRPGATENVRVFLDETVAGESGMTARETNPHCVRVHPSGRFLLATFMRAERVRVWALTAAGEIGEAVATARFAARSGPRHLEFADEGREIFVSCESSNEVQRWRFDEQTGELRHAQTLPTLPAGTTRKSFAGDVKLSPDGRLLAVTNRGHDSVAIFAVRRTPEGAISLAAPTWVDAHGKFPWGLAFHANSRLLLVSNRDSDDIRSFHVDTARAEAEWTGHRLPVPRPVHIEPGAPVRGGG